MKKILLALLLLTMSFPAFAEEKQSAYDRIMRTGEIRCGYIIFPPHIIKDPNTGKMSGIIYDIMEEAGKLLDVKINWAEEVGLATMNTGLKAERYDSICFGYWQNPAEAKLGYIGYSVPLYYMPVGAFVRADDKRFDGNVTALNDPAIRVSSSDGMISTIIARQDFPKAKVLSLPNMTDVSQNLMDVSLGKADVAFLALRDGLAFQEKNPEKIKNITQEQPVRVFGSTIAIPQGDQQFKVMLDAALIQMINAGFVDRVLKKYEEYPGAVFPPTKPYELTK